MFGKSQGSVEEVPSRKCLRSVMEVFRKFGGGIKEVLWKYQGIVLLGPRTCHGSVKEVLRKC